MRVTPPQWQWRTTRRRWCRRSDRGPGTPWNRLRRAAGESATRSARDLGASERMVSAWCARRGALPGGPWAASSRTRTRDASAAEAGPPMRPCASSSSAGAGASRRNGGSGAAGTGSLGSAAAVAARNAPARTVATIRRRPSLRPSIGILRRGPQDAPPPRAAAEDLHRWKPRPAPLRAYRHAAPTGRGLCVTAGRAPLPRRRPASRGCRP